ncbi:MAG: hypothetical protein LBU92_02130 [Prevotellaceae bacterium]|jgi:hypothetical protein|nr:hypothetical protein [Prevotellaceae bacterium]
MKKFALITIAFFALLNAKAQLAERLTFTTSIGTGIAISEQESLPFFWQISGSYNFNERFSAGAGTGFSLYEKALIPLFANAKFNLVKPRKFTPYVDCSLGYSFAPSNEAIGGLHLNPSLGVEYSIFESKKIFFAVGYEMQKLKRIKKYANQYFEAEFEEQLSHSTISLKLGFAF